MGKALTDAKKRLATQLYASGGMTVTAIAKTIGVGQATLSNWFNKQPWYKTRYTDPRSIPNSRDERWGDPVKANRGLSENTFVIPEPLPGMNEYIKALNGSRYEGDKLKKHTEEMICTCIRLGLGVIEPLETMAQIHISFYEKDRRRDYDNIASGTKFILDALRKSGVIYNDGQSYLEPCSYDYYVDPKYPRVEVRINPLADKKLSKTLTRRTAVHKANNLRYMSDGEIVRDYNAAQNKKEQIKILAELNAMSEDEVVRIIEEAQE